MSTPRWVLYNAITGYEIADLAIAENNASYSVDVFGRDSASLSIATEGLDTSLLEPYNVNVAYLEDDLVLFDGPLARSTKSSESSRWNLECTSFKGFLAYRYATKGILGTGQLDVSVTTDGVITLTGHPAEIIQSLVQHNFQTIQPSPQNIEYVSTPAGNFSIHYSMTDSGSIESFMDAMNDDPTGIEMRWNSRYDRAQKRFYRFLLFPRAGRIIQSNLNVAEPITHDIDVNEAKVSFADSWGNNGNVWRVVQPGSAENKSQIIVFGSGATSGKMAIEQKIRFERALTAGEMNQQIAPRLADGYPNREVTGDIQRGLDSPQDRVFLLGDRFRFVNGAGDNEVFSFTTRVVGFRTDAHSDILSLQLADLRAVYARTPRSLREQIQRNINDAINDFNYWDAPGTVIDQIEPDFTIDPGTDPDPGTDLPPDEDPTTPLQEWDDFTGQRMDPWDPSHGQLFTPTDNTDQRWALSDTRYSPHEPRDGTNWNFVIMEDQQYQLWAGRSLNGAIAMIKAQNAPLGAFRDQLIEQAALGPNGVGRPPANTSQYGGGWILSYQDSVVRAVGMFTEDEKLYVAFLVRTAFSDTDLSSFSQRRYGYRTVFMRADINEEATDVANWVIYGGALAHGYEDNAINPEGGEADDPINFKVYPFITRDGWLCTTVGKLNSIRTARISDLAFWTTTEGSVGQDAANAGLPTRFPDAMKVAHPSKFVIARSMIQAEGFSIWTIKPTLSFEGSEPVVQYYMMEYPLDEGSNGFIGTQQGQWFQWVLNDPGFFYYPDRGPYGEGFSTYSAAVDQNGGVVFLSLRFDEYGSATTIALAPPYDQAGEGNTVVFREFGINYTMSPGEISSYRVYGRTESDGNVSHATWGYGIARFEFIDNN